MLFTALLLPVGLLLSPSGSLHRVGRPACAARAGRVFAALDYKDPTVAAEFLQAQTLSERELEQELGLMGITAPPSMNDVDQRLMLVEARMRKAGTLPGNTKKETKPAKYANRFEELMWEKPGFKRLIDDYRLFREMNSLNYATEYIMDPRMAKERYGGDKPYEKVVAAVEAAIKQKFAQKVTSGRLEWSGFPASMGEAAVRQTLGAFGELKSLTFEESDDGISCKGTAEYATADEAEAAIDKYDGVDMGLGTKLTFTAV